MDRSVDLLVTGTGAAGLAAAITAADAGLETLVVESTDRWGGTTMRSGGGLWMPANPLIIVDRSGARYTNESASYIDFGHDMLERNRTTPAIPSWLIVDRRHRRRYLFSPLLMGGKQIREAGTVVTAGTLDELGRRISIDPSALRATVQRFNAFARRGVDEDFGRGRTAYDNYDGDPRVKPNPNLGPIEKGPFTAVKIVPGDLGTKGGLLTDEHARALDEDGVPIAGLYAAGNTTASVMGRTYPGPGSTIAPAVVFGYLGALHAAGASLSPVATGGDPTDRKEPNE